MGKTSWQATKHSPSLANTQLTPTASPAAGRAELLSSPLPPAIAELDAGAEPVAPALTADEEGETK